MPPAFSRSTEIGAAPLAGVVPPVVLPLSDDGAVDSASLERHVNHLVEAGVAGLWVNGTTGEFYALDVELRARVVRECVKAVAGRVPVVAHVGDTSTDLALQHARAAVAAGAEHLSVLPPYFVGFGSDELKAHLRVLARAVGGPVFAYHLPQLAPATLGVDAIVELAAEGFVCGIKDSSSNMLWFRQLRLGLEAAGVRLPCFTGGSSVTDLGYFLGATGTVSSTGNLTPRHLVAQHEAARCGDWDTVRALQDQTEHLIARLLPPGMVGSPGLTAAAYKYVLTVLGRIDSERTARPQAVLPAAARQHLDADVLPLVEQLESAPPRPPAA
ncbi:dihydrodipicolinate synthase family protein [Desertihabitans aurantiacus]|uniref:dihydrodipicolinate synthase family protein n=1 Tax=Desertihabitans aurantiacus TaxID=2282477 RepID=UPI000DF7DFB5|nr:dihydrodipicolinate synthase family protein [Desertihabitans aurantiacus]